jgi:hypothetical protein
MSGIRPEICKENPDVDVLFLTIMAVATESQGPIAAQRSPRYNKEQLFLIRWREHMSRRGFGNITLAVFCLGIFAASLSVFRGLFGSDAEVSRPVFFWALVSVALALNAFYAVILVLRRRALAQRVHRT